MPFCSQCGAAAEGKFCRNCGAPFGGDTDGQTDSSTSPELGFNVASALSYIPGLIFAVLFLVWNPYKKDKFVRFHAFQSIFLQCAWIVVIVVSGFVLSAVSATVTVVVERLASLGFLVLAGIVAYKAYQHQRIVLPFLGEWAEKQV